MNGLGDLLCLVQKPYFSILLEPMYPGSTRCLARGVALSQCLNRAYSTPLIHRTPTTPRLQDIGSGIRETDSLTRTPLGCVPPKARVHHAFCPSSHVQSVTQLCPLLSEVLEEQLRVGHSAFRSRINECFIPLQSVQAMVHYMLKLEHAPLHLVPVELAMKSLVTRVELVIHLP